MTAVEWLMDYLDKNRYWIGNDLLEAAEQAKEMEKEQLNIARIDGINLSNKGYGSKGSDERIVDTNKTIISQTEISDEELEKLAELQYPYNQLTSTELKGLIVSAERAAWIEGIKWYRKQLKSK